MNQKKIDGAMLQIAKTMSKLSNCVAFQVGAVVANKGRIISTGYNGSPSGHKNCNEQFKTYDEHLDRQVHSDWSSIHEIHAEQNALMFAARFGTSVDGASMYITHQPCPNCSKLIVASGIERVVFLEHYDRFDERSWQMLFDNHVRMVGWNERQN